LAAHSVEAVALQQLQQHSVTLASLVVVVVDAVVAVPLEVDVAAVVGY